ncbi:MAG: hypothetical protein ABEI75_02525 [Halobaculum sp.]
MSWYERAVLAFLQASLVGGPLTVVFDFWGTLLAALCTTLVVFRQIDAHVRQVVESPDGF